MWSLCGKDGRLKGSSISQLGGVEGGTVELLLSAFCIDSVAAVMGGISVASRTATEAALKTYRSEYSFPFLNSDAAYIFVCVPGCFVGATTGSSAVECTVPSPNSILSTRHDASGNWSRPPSEHPRR